MPGPASSLRSVDRVDDKTAGNSYAGPHAAMPDRPDDRTHGLATVGLDHARTALQRRIVREIAKLGGTAQDHRNIQRGLLAHGQRQQAAEAACHRIGVAGPLAPCLGLDSPGRGADAMEHIGDAHFRLGGPVGSRGLCHFHVLCPSEPL
ncbi:hypothetical protein CO2235_U770004 [Cupriavidus oxalaticus]|uniref:Uncharacterized protein n=1 Tax=Cupriavidus oxalaticus TaxID=96344 RepID=A0A375FRI5_9BURK|nr:hypothetical protein CO2235_U770004 [Cupriavidus oxalaticus]